jgi:hypothetical protein
MKLATFLSLMALPGAFAQSRDESAGLATRVREEVLDQLRPVSVNVSTHGITTLQFPAKVEALDGDGFTQKSDEAGVFLFTPGVSWVSLKALRPGAQQNLNVIIAGKVYPVVVKANEANDFSVIFRFAGQGALPQTAAEAAKGRAPKKPLSDARLLGFLDKLKGYPLFAEKAPAMYLNCDVAEPAAGKGVDETDKVKSRIVRVIRDNQLDAVGFDVVLTNKTGDAYLYNPSGLAIRAGKEVYPASVGDGLGKIPPHGQQSAFFVVAGSANSNVANDLSAYNDFNLVLSN